MIGITEYPISSYNLFESGLKSDTIKNIPLILSLIRNNIIKNHKGFRELTC